MWESTGPLVAVLAPLVAVPLTVITFYLRSLREHQLTWHAAITHRVERMETSIAELRRAFADLGRDYTTKEEWLRECTHARRVLEQLNKAVVRMEAILETSLPRLTGTTREHQRADPRSALRSAPHS